MNDRELIQQLVSYAGVSASEIARRAGLAVSTLTRPLNHDVNYKLSKSTLDRLKETFPACPIWSDGEAVAVVTVDYEKVKVIPPFEENRGGEGQDESQEYALVPRSLIRHALHGTPDDFVMISIRGNSMEPEFLHGDQILIDTRDTSPTQPGPFAISLGDGYVVANVERMPGGEVRIFPTNARYSPITTRLDGLEILGRPVWVCRKL